jgi:hypothetical protein
MNLLREVSDMTFDTGWQVEQVWQRERERELTHGTANSFKVILAILQERTVLTQCTDVFL